MYGTYCRLGVSIYATDDEVVEALRRKLRPEAHGTERERRLIEEILMIHRNERDLARDLRL